MSHFTEHLNIGKTALLTVSVGNSPTTTGNTILVIAMGGDGNRSSATITLSEQEAKAFADALPTLQHFIHGAYGLMDSFAEEFDKRMRENDGIGLTDPD